MFGTQIVKQRQAEAGEAAEALESSWSGKGADSWIGKGADTKGASDQQPNRSYAARWQTSISHGERPQDTQQDGRAFQWPCSMSEVHGCQLPAFCAPSIVPACQHAQLLHGAV